MLARRLTMASALAAALLVTSCSSTPEALDKSPSAVRTTKTYSENYQEVYRRLVGTARRCGTSTGSHVSFEVDADLYNEFGYGEVTQSLQDLGARNYYWKAKIERAGSGSKLSVVSGNTLAKGSTLRTVVGWADGNTSCY